ncbi:MAG: DciA family protein [Pseudomonadota bacterium]
METRIRNAGEARGFAVTRLLTHWAEIVGKDTASRARPVNVSYSKGGFGATLTVLTTAAQAPMLQMQLPEIREKVNACYGYNAIARIRITQTAPTGFAEGQVAFTDAEPKPPTRDPVIQARAADVAGGVENETLREALTALGENVLRSSRG